MVPNGFIALHHKGFGQKSPSKVVHFKDLGKVCQLNTSENQSCTFGKLLTAELVLPFDSQWESAGKPFSRGNPCEQNHVLVFHSQQLHWLRCSGAGECHRISKEKGK